MLGPRYTPAPVGAPALAGCWEPLAGWAPLQCVQWLSDVALHECVRPRAETIGQVKRKIMGLNAAKLYGIEVPSEFQLPKAA